MLTKLSIDLTLAFQESEGPFKVHVEHTDNSGYYTSLDKMNILSLIKDEKISTIKLDQRSLEDRRWRQRPSKDRRLSLQSREAKRSRQRTQFNDFRGKWSRK
jgi:hypothetical protein